MPRGVVSGEKQERGEAKKREEKKREMRKAVRNNERKGKMRKGESKDSGVGQRQTATAARLARGGSRARAIVPSRVLYFSSFSHPSTFLDAREQEARTVGFIVFELDASLFCFVSRAIRGANCRSYAIAFCFLLLPPFLHDPLLSVVSALRFATIITTVLFFCSMHPPTDTTTDHDADREGRLSHSPRSLSSLARSS